MFGGNNGISLADIAAVCKNGNGNCNDGFGGNNAWWVLIILWALWGDGRDNNRNRGGGDCGCGSNSGGGSVVYNVGAEMQRGFDTQSIIQKLDGLNSGLCSLGYDQLAQMNGITSTIQQTGFNLQSALNQLGISNMQQFNQLMALVERCCCDQRQATSDLKYTMATDTCAVTTAISNAARNIIDNDNNNYRQLHDEMVAQRMQDMRDQLSQKDTLINLLNLKSSQEGQTAEIINGVLARLRECPVGTYNVCNPNCCNNNQFDQLVQLLANNGNGGCGCGGNRGTNF